MVVGGLGESSNTPVVRAFLALQLTGAAAFALILFSAWLSRAKRHPIWFSFCVAWPVFCISYCILFLAGQQVATPDYGLCVTQSALVYAAPPLASGASLSLVVHLLLDIRAALSNLPAKKKNPAFIAVLLIVPWLSWIAILVGLLVFGLRHPDLVETSIHGTYCILVGTALTNLTSIWSAIASVSMVCVEAVIGVILYRKRASLSGFDQWTAMATRVAIFSILGVTAIVISVIYTVIDKRGPAFDIVLALLPPCTAVIFGSQMDLLRGWMLHKRRHVSETVETPFTSLSTLTLPGMTFSAP